MRTSALTSQVCHSRCPDTRLACHTSVHPLAKDHSCQERPSAQQHARARRLLCRPPIARLSPVHQSPVALPSCPTPAFRQGNPSVVSPFRRSIAALSSPTCRRPSTPSSLPPLPPHPPLDSLAPPPSPFSLLPSPVAAGCCPHFVFAPPARVKAPQAHPIWSSASPITIWRPVI